MARRTLSTLVLALSVAACASGRPGIDDEGGRAAPKSSEPAVVAGFPAGDGRGDWAQLADRPLKLPRLPPGQACPQSTLRQPDPQRLGMALGDGPVFAVGGQLVRSSQSSGNKVLWAADPKYSGPIRIRGGQLDGDGQLLLGGPIHNYWSGPPLKHVSGFDLYPELDLLEPGTPTGAPWRNWPSTTYVAEPGCYAWQVDGLGFTEVIIFHA